MPVREDGGNLPPFFYQRNQVIILCVWFYRHVKIRSWQIVVAPPESKLLGLPSKNCIATTFSLDISHDDPPLYLFVCFPYLLVISVFLTASVPSVTGSQLP